MNQTLKATVNAECTIKNHLPATATYLSRPNPIPVRPGPERFIRFAGLESNDQSQHACFFHQNRHTIS